jgi:hypothetical protein
MKHALVVLTTALILAAAAAGPAHADPPQPAGPTTEICFPLPVVTVGGKPLNPEPVCLPWPW